MLGKISPDSSGVVEENLKRREGAIGESQYIERRQWNRILESIAHGIVAIDEVGNNYQDSIWQDDTFVTHSGLHKVQAVNDFEGNLRRLFKTALNILDKDVFVIAFDDIDVDVEQGWKVMETIRRYLSDKQVISLVTGNIKLYSMLVKANLSKKLSLPKGPAKENMANELESQYMLKLLNPSNRINIGTVQKFLQIEKDTVVEVRIEDGEPREIKKAYTEILQRFNIVDAVSIRLFIDFFTSMSLRSQIHFLRNELSNSNPFIPLDVFSTRLNAEGLDLSVLEADAQLTNISILDYLLKRENISELYLLLPSASDKDVNSNLTAFTLLEVAHFRNSPGAMLDYMLRLAYVRNATYARNDAKDTRNFCQYSGWTQKMSLKNSIALSMAFRMVKFGELSLKGDIPIYGLEIISKKDGNNALDKLIRSEEDPMKRLLATFPYIQIGYSHRKGTEGFYSPFILLAAISEIMMSEGSAQSIAAKISDLKLFRTYPAPEKETVTIPDNEGDVIENEDSLNIQQDAITTLAFKMQNWMQRFNEDRVLPPFVLGRIMTRFYTSAQNVNAETVGLRMNLLMVTFLNACLVEEARTHLHEVDYLFVDNDNPRNATSIFTENIKRVKNGIILLPFTSIMLTCPLIYCYLSEDIQEAINQIIPSNLILMKDISIFSLLNQIFPKVSGAGKSKMPEPIHVEDSESTKMSFSGSKKLFWKTYDTILKAGEEYVRAIDAFLSGEKTAEETQKFFKLSNLFSRVYLDSVKTFKDNFSLEKYKELSEKHR